MKQKCTFELNTHAIIIDMRFTKRDAWLVLNSIFVVLFFSRERHEYELVDYSLSVFEFFSLLLFKFLIWKMKALMCKYSLIFLFSKTLKSTLSPPLLSFFFSSLDPLKLVQKFVQYHFWSSKISRQKFGTFCNVQAALKVAAAQKQLFLWNVCVLWSFLLGRYKKSCKYTFIVKNKFRVAWSNFHEIRMTFRASVNLSQLELPSLFNQEMTYNGMLAKNFLFGPLKN